MVYANQFACGDDNETIKRAIENREPDGIVVIQPRRSEVEPERDYWLLDQAILLPENTTVILQNCTIKLSDKCRDNFFRSANCGIGIPYPERIRNIHIRGEGMCTLLGADHPRAVGDGGKILANPCPYRPEDIRALGKWEPAQWHDYSYGTDAGKEGESQFGDWRGIGVLLANVEHFSIENLRIVDSHGWGISLEACAHGRVSRIEFSAYMYKMIDGMLSNMENQDGIDIRNGCHDIVISDISGCTGDDLIALTAVANHNFLPGGSMRTTHVMHNDWSKRERDIYNIVIRNVVGYSNLCWTVRLLAAYSVIHDVVIDGVINTGPDYCGAGILIGEPDGAYGKNLPDSIRNITISNVISGGVKVIQLDGYLTDSVITNVIYKGPEQEGMKFARFDGVKNVTITNYCQTRYRGKQ